jgi:minor extracellular serine protease Vpr
LSRKHTRVAAAVGTVAVAASLATAQWASGAPAHKASPLARFHRVAAQTVSAKNIQGLNPDRQITVMLQAAGRPAALVQAHAGHPLSLGRWNSVRSELKAQQAPIAAAVRALGGKVGNRYQAAYNGMKVTIAASKLGALRNVPNVAGVHAIVPKTVSNVHGVPLVGAPQVWDGVNGFHGEGMKIAVIDTGIDYTHADFGGPGTVAAYQQALATDTADPNPALVGPGAPRVKGGTDFVGDDYNADPTDPHYQPVPHPDNNPLDCNGHGTHTAGTAAGSGVLADGNTYTGPYNANTIAANSWNVGPGVAPKSNIYSLRVFGCAGSSDVVVDAIEWAMDHHMDVINMSLGSPFGGPSDPDAVASNNAAKAGTIVVTSAGNEGPNPYMTGTPGTADATISTAASDPTPSFPGVDIALSGGTTLHGIDANGIPVNGLTAPIKVLYTGSPSVANISLGCDPNEYTAAGVSGDIVVVKRGTCARVARAIFGEEAGAAAVIMVNNVNSLPPFEGPITNNPDDGTPFDVTIPFLGVKSSDAAALVAADGTVAALTDTTLANPSFLATASFSSGGPRSGDSALKPDLTGPGVSIASAGMGTGNQFAVLSGTSMASPHVAGSAALVRQAHPSWGLVKYWKAALVNTADPALVADYTTRINGNGFVQVQKAVKTQVVATSVNDTATISYGFAETNTTFTQNRVVHLKNFGNTVATFSVGHSLDAGSPHTVSPSVKTVRVPAHGIASFSVALRVPAKTVGDSSAFRDVSGRITLTPTGGSNSGIGLALAYYMVPRATSKIHTALNMQQVLSRGSSRATVTNSGGAIAGTADWYAWGTSDPKETGLGPNDIRAVGVQTFPQQGGFAFGLNTWKRWSNAAANEFDIFVDVNGDDTADYDVVEADVGAVTAGDNDGRPGVFVVDLRTHEASLDFLADAPTDSTTMAMPVLFDQLCNDGSPCIDDNSGRITYYAVGFYNGTADEPSSEATFNVLNPSISTGMFDTVAPYHAVGETVAINPGEFAQTPPLGVMVLSHDNLASTEAQLIPFP